MNVSRAIEQLTKILNEVGDLEMVMVQEVDGMFAIGREFILDVIGVPGLCDHTDEKSNVIPLNDETLVCAFMEPAGNGQESWLEE